MRATAKASPAGAARLRLGLACTAAICALAGLFAAQASAVTYFHPFISSFGPDGKSTSTFSAVGRVAVDQKSHDVLVVNNGATAKKTNILRFDSSGEPKNFTEGPAAGTNKLTGFENASVAVAPPGAVGGTEGDIYVLNEGKVDIYSAEGAFLGEIDGSGNPHPPPENYKGLGPELNSLAIDASGNVYVAWETAGGSAEKGSHIDKYVPGGNPLSNADFDSQIVGFGATPCPLAASSATLYVIVGCSGNGSGAAYPLSAFPGGGGTADASGLASSFPVAAGAATSAAVDLSSSDVYSVGSEGSFEYIRQVDKDGKPLSIFSPLGFPDGSLKMRGVSVDGTSGKVYFSTSGVGNGGNGGRVFIYGPGIVVQPAEATIDPPTGITLQSTDFSGTANAGGSGEAQEATYRFQCTPSCPGLKGERELPADGLDHEVTDSAEGLKPETKYEVTLSVTNLAGTVKSTVSFETPVKPAIVLPQVTIDLASGITATTAHLSGTVDPGGSGELQATTYRFEYLDGLEWVPLPKGGPIEGTGPQEVSAELSRLEPNTAYSVRLRAENLGGAVTSAMPDPVFGTDEVAPFAEATAATQVEATSAQLNARIRPHNLATSYYFQWGSGDCDSGGCASVPATQDGDAGAGDAFVFVKAELKGLAPNTAYHYRLIAQSEAGKTTTATKNFSTPEAAPACPNAGLRNGASASLADCRAYEMVSPLQKSGGDISGDPRRTRVATDGNAVSYMSRAGFAGTEGLSANGAEYLSRRSSSGWGTYPITPRVDAPLTPSVFADSQYVGAFSADLSRGVFRALAPVNDITAPNAIGVSNLYLGSALGSPGSTMALLSDSVNPLGYENSELESGYVPPIQFADASDDFSHILFESANNLTADASGERNKLYEWIEGKGTRLAGILPDSACGLPPCPASSSAAGQAAQNLSAFAYIGTFTQASNTISADGSRVFFTAPVSSDTSAAGGPLYLREDGTTTVRIDASERSEPIPADSGTSEFQAATPDGSKAFFLSTRSLTDDDRDGGSKDLYRYDVEAPAGHHLTLMTPQRKTPNALSISGVPGISEDGSYVYFEGVKPGDNNTASLFLLHDGEALFVARREGVSWGEAGTFTFNQFRVSPDGRHALLASGNNNGYDLGKHNGLFLYSADSDELSCVSCNPSGAEAKGDASFYADISGKGDSAQQYLSGPLSTDGRRAFFSTKDALVPEDSNGKLDAYEYDSESGKLALISSGQCNCNSVWVGASQSGNDAFFTTREQLVLADTDDLYDIYDARVGGGIASQNQLPPVGCEGDACQPVNNPPSPQTPSSSGFSGPGNPPAKSRKHKAKKKKRHRHTAAAKRHERHGSRSANGKQG